MMRILFVCHGNICRSPMAEFIMKDLVAKRGLSDGFRIESCATSTEELGCDIYPPAKRKLAERGIPFSRHAAHKMTRADYDYYDHIICMDRSNLRLLRYIIGEDSAGKVSLLMAWANRSDDVADPWYTGDFDATYRDLLAGCTALLNELKIV